MGFSLQILTILEEKIKNKIFIPPFCSLGDQRVSDSDQIYNDFIKKNNYKKMQSDRSLRVLLEEHFNIYDYEDIDINDKASLKIDLSKEVPVDMKERFNMIYDGGTSEHIFD